MEPINRRITRDEAQEYLRKIAKQTSALTARSKHGRERITYRFHEDDGTKNYLVYTEVANGTERGRVHVGLGPDGLPMIMSSYHITPKVALTQLPAEQNKRDMANAPRKTRVNKRIVTR